MAQKKSLRILLIDDDKDDQFFFVRTIEDIQSSIVCELADNGLKGLSALLKNPNPDIIFLDLNMPQMNGFDFLEIIKKDENFKHIPVIIFTTSSHLQDIEKAKELKAVAFLTKPNNLNNLSQLLTKALHLDFSMYTEINIIH
ncbi:MAG: response regulator [Bacteroidia bacterium]|nr:response regulator [Bacteroidia bacterium]